MRKIIQAGKFKARCLKIMDEVNKTKKCVIITKRNIPIVEIRPLHEEKIPLFGKMKGTIKFTGDIIQPIEEEWNAFN